MRTLLLKVHIYAGLLCSSYLLIFGISSLNYNHKFGKPKNEVVTWERSLKVLDMKDDEAFSRAVRDALGLIGRPLPRETRRDDRGNFQFGLARPGKHYTIRVFFNENRVRVEETRKGLWAVLGSLHGFTGVPASPFTYIWALYTELCTWVVLFAAVSGVYLWSRREKERFIGWILVVGAAGTSLFLMVYVWWRG